MRIPVRMLSVAVVLCGLVAAVAAQDPIYEPGQGITLPKATKQVNARYTSEAMQARIQGEVVLSVVVLADGGVGEVKVVKSLDTEHGLDQSAVDAMKQWLFEPGRKDDRPVAVRVKVEMTFTMK